MSDPSKAETGGDHWDALLQQAVDGTLSTEEKAELSAAMSADPALQAQLDDYRRLSAMIGALPVEEPSADFTNRVMAALPPGLPAGAARAPGRAPDRASSAPRRTGLLSGLFGPRVRLAYAFSAIAMIAVAGVFVFQIAGIDRGAATGTIVSQQTGVVDLAIGEATLNFRPIEGGEQIIAQIPEGSVLNLAVSGDLDSDEYDLNASRPVNLEGSEDAYVLILTGTGTLTATLWSDEYEVATETVEIE
jgi:hypothetical protein